MSKIYTIGRDETCDIIIDDTTDVVSRIHATLKSKGKGKFMLVDQSRNGTYVNGIRMTANEEIPVTRKDIISFAHVHDLDWTKVPEDGSSITRKIMVLFFVLVLIAVISFGLIKYLQCSDVQNPSLSDNNPLSEATDSIKSDSIKIVRDTVYFKPKQIPEKKGKDKEKDVVEEKPKEEEVINPVY